MPFSPASPSLPTIQERDKRIPVYSFSWASAIMAKAIESRARVWKDLLAFLGLSERQCAYLIACNDPAWPFIRTLSHTLDKWQARLTLYSPKIPEITIQLFSTLWSVHKNLCPESMKPYLTARIKQLTLEEQVKKGEGDGNPSSSGLSGAKGDSDGQCQFDFGE